jgi:hypothetical protein
MRENPHAQGGTDLLNLVEMMDDLLGFGRDGSVVMMRFRSEANSTGKRSLERVLPVGKR